VAKACNKLEICTILRCTYLSICTLCDFFQVILCTCCYPSKEQLFRNPTAQCHAHPIKQLLLAVQVLLFGQILSITQPFAPRYNRNLKEILIMFIIVCQEDFKAACQLETALNICGSVHHA